MTTLRDKLERSIKNELFQSRKEAELNYPRNTKGGSITVPLTSCLIGLKSAL
jgi:hypothetical protein